MCAILVFNGSKCYNNVMWVCNGSQLMQYICTCFLAGKTPFTNIKSAAVTVKKPLAGAQSTLALSASTGNNKMCMHSVFGSTIYNY